jgi:hypothetical protein
MWSLKVAVLHLPYTVSTRFQSDKWLGDADAGVGKRSRRTKSKRAAVCMERIPTETSSKRSVEENLHEGELHSRTVPSLYSTTIAKKVRVEGEAAKLEYSTKSGKKSNPNSGRALCKEISVAP